MLVKNHWKIVLNGLMTYKIELTKQALKDLQNLQSANLKNKALKIRSILSINPYKLPYKKLSGNLAGKYSRRINHKHRIVYEVLEKINTVKVLRMWSHYE